MNETEQTTELTSQCTTCISEASCSTCHTGLCPGTVLAGIFAVIWLAVAIWARRVTARAQATETNEE
ncbi:Unannotated [Lentimonas sp. CC4]|nr:Unannotated [Lentimonas sp. CC4]CAA6684525.1 Unannotated [Lentimonas sp. CC6]CAA7077397.1 Unannotated [Lentimonas sp. CC4]CAA7171233.1 Unannotated [Lentimonas sp. CC21]CAA7183262.1 Unannotated [Lentimonas sp. CC8]